MAGRRELAAIATAAILGSSPAAAQASGPRVDAEQYEGWRQYSVQCARCHGQDVLGNPVAADLLESAGPGGPVEARAAFVSVVKVGRPSHGMPGFATLLTDDQIGAVYAYVKGRADGAIKAGRPKRPTG